jgi:hypothetical protein
VPIPQVEAFISAALDDAGHSNGRGPDDNGKHVRVVGSVHVGPAGAVTREGASCAGPSKESIPEEVQDTKLLLEVKSDIKQAPSEPH